jgi:hypothetical protein
MTGTKNGSQSVKRTAELRSGAGMAGGSKTGGKGGKAMRSSGVNKRVAVTVGDAKAGPQLGRGVGKGGAGSSNKGSGSGSEGREITKITGKGAFARDMRCVGLFLMGCVSKERLHVLQKLRVSGERFTQTCSELPIPVNPMSAT